MRDLSDAQALADRLGESYELHYVKNETGWSVGRAALVGDALETVVVSRSPGSAHFAYAVGGEWIVAFDPGYPAPETMWGADPGRLAHLMNALGLHPPDDESEETWTDADARALLLAERITGLLEVPA